MRELSPVTPLAQSVTLTATLRLWVTAALRLGTVLLLAAFVLQVGHSASVYMNGYWHELLTPRFSLLTEKILAAVLQNFYLLPTALALQIAGKFAVPWIVPTMLGGCPRCGYEIDRQMLLCPECGMQLRKAPGIEHGRVSVRELQTLRPSDGRAHAGPELGPASLDKETA